VAHKRRDSQELPEGIAEWLNSRFGDAERLRLESFLNVCIRDSQELPEGFTLRVCFNRRFFGIRTELPEGIAE
jgi:hypothetical protein